uniref:Uncharacterized protein n=1 Tax=Onchocerca volvulus TaxID=6282 RepID=A0A8R1TVP3_ONCVO
MPTVIASAPVFGPEIRNCVNLNSKNAILDQPKHAIAQVTSWPKECQHQRLYSFRKQHLPHKHCAFAIEISIDSFFSDIKNCSSEITKNYTYCGYNRKERRRKERKRKKKEIH